MFAQARREHGPSRNSTSSFPNCRENTTEEVFGGRACFLRGTDRGGRGADLSVAAGEHGGGMSELVDFLCAGEHPVEASQRQNTREVMKAPIEQGSVHVNLSDTRGGTELGVPIYRIRCDLRAIEGDNGSSEIRLVGDLTLDFVPVTCFARIDLATLRGEGHLERR